MVPQTGDRHCNAQDGHGIGGKQRNENLVHSALFRDPGFVVQCVETGGIVHNAHDLPQKNDDAEYHSHIIEEDPYVGLGVDYPECHGAGLVRVEAAVF